MPTRSRARVIHRRRLVAGFGSVIGDSRRRQGLSRAALARMSGCSRQAIGAIEDGLANPTLGLVADILHGLHVELELNPRGPVVLAARPQRDAAHAICSGYVQRRLESLGFLVRREVMVRQGRYVGWVDLVAYHADLGLLVIIELKTRIDDLGQIERTTDWYARSVPAAVAEFGWRPRRIDSWLLCLATDEVEERIARHRDVVDRAFPRRAADMLSAVAAAGTARPPGVGRGIALIDPRRRGSTWLIRTRLDGRRSPAPYSGYAEFMRGRGGR